MTVANVNKRTTETKFVTCFADARPDVDVTFRDVLLSRPTDHYLVGVDNFSMVSTGLSMIEPLTGDQQALIRIVKNKPADNPVAATNTGPNIDLAFLEIEHDLAYMRVANAGFNFEILTTEVQQSLQQLLHRLNELAANVNLFMNTGLAAAAVFGGEYSYTAAADEHETKTEHLRFDVRSDGRLEIKGTRAFWGCFSIEFPSPQYQFGFLGDRQLTDDNDFRIRRFLSNNPVTGVPTFNKIKVNPDNFTVAQFAALQTIIDDKREVAKGGATDAEKAQAQATRDAKHIYNRRTTSGDQTKALAGATDLGGTNPNTFNTHAGATHAEVLTFTSDACVFSTLERRVALEIGCSLPIKNSPMIDHQKETPDFVLGRWIWRSDSRIESNDRGGSRRYASAMPACIEYQGPQDRITYHELQAQAKIQTLRLKLFARVRAFDPVSETWTMRVVALPTKGTDWWHARLHFVSKD